MLGMERSRQVKGNRLSDSFDVREWIREQVKRRDVGGLPEAWARRVVEVPLFKIGKIEEASLEGDNGLCVGFIYLVRRLGDKQMEMSSKQLGTWIWDSGQREAWYVDWEAISACYLKL